MTKAPGGAFGSVGVRIVTEALLLEEGDGKGLAGIGDY